MTKICPYHWAPSYNGYKPTIDKLNWGANLASIINLSDTIRVALGYESDPSYDFTVAPIPGESEFLKRTAQQEPYRLLFNNSNFNTFILTTYTPQAYVGSASNGGNWSQINHTTEQAEYTNLTQYLASTYPTKRFILSNWEADNEGANGGTIAAFISTLGDRVTAIKNVGAGNVFSMIEISQTGGLILPYLNNTIKPNYLGYSAWQNLSPYSDTFNANNMRNALIGAFNTINTVTNFQYVDKLMLSEFGRQRPPAKMLLEAYEWFDVILDVIKYHEIQYAIYWQLTYDPTGDPSSNLIGLFDNDNQPTINYSNILRINNKILKG